MLFPSLFLVLILHTFDSQVKTVSTVNSNLIKLKQARGGDDDYWENRDGNYRQVFVSFLLLVFSLAMIQDQTSVASKGGVPSFKSA